MDRPRDSVRKGERLWVDGNQSKLRVEENRYMWTNWPRTDRLGKDLSTDLERICPKILPGSSTWDALGS